MAHRPTLPQLTWYFRETRCDMALGLAKVPVLQGMMRLVKSPCFRAEATFQAGGVAVSRVKVSADGRGDGSTSRLRETASRRKRNAGGVGHDAQMSREYLVPAGTTVVRKIGALKARPAREGN
jgi:hypothetical protein